MTATKTGGASVIELASRAAQQRKTALANEYWSLLARDEAATEADGQRLMEVSQELGIGPDDHRKNLDLMHAVAAAEAAEARRPILLARHKATLRRGKEERALIEAERLAWEARWSAREDDAVRAEGRAFSELNKANEEGRKLSGLLPQFAQATGGYTSSVRPSVPAAESVSREQVLEELAQRMRDSAAGKAASLRDAMQAGNERLYLAGLDRLSVDELEQLGAVIKLNVRKERSAIIDAAVKGFTDADIVASVRRSIAERLADAGLGDFSAEDADAFAVAVRARMLPSIIAGVVGSETLNPIRMLRAVKAVNVALACMGLSQLKGEESRKLADRGRVDLGELSPEVLSAMRLDPALSATYRGNLLDPTSV